MSLQESLEVLPGFVVPSDYLTATDLAAMDGEGGPGPACTALILKCPTFFDM